MKAAGPLILLLIFGITLSATAQSSSADEDAPTVIRGTIVDEQAGDPVESATVALWTTPPDSSLVTGTITRADGSFQLEHDRAGDYFVRISFVGYQPKVVTDVSIGEEAQEVDLGELTLAEDTEELDEVEVSAEREYMQVEADKTVYNPQNQPVTAGGTARNVLEEIPSVDVDIDGNISLRGSGNVAIYLNGKPAPMSGQALTSFLEGLSSEDIERVEVIPNPSVREKPEGTSGIINIVLAEDSERGWGGSVSAGISTDNDYNGSGNVDYGSGPWNVFSNYSFRYDEDFDTSSRYRINQFLEPTTFLNQESREEENDINHTFNTTVEYELDEIHTLSFRSVFSRRGDSGEELTEYTELGPDSAMTSRYDRQTLTDEADTGVDFRLDFERIVEPNEHELTAEIDYERDAERGQDHYIQHDIIDGGDVQQLAEEQRIDEREDEQEASLEVEYVRPMWGDSQIEAGYEADYEQLSSDFYSESLNLNTDTFEPDTDINNDFTYNELIHSLFGIFNGSLGNFNAQLGVRAERALTTFNQQTLGESFDNSYFSVFPSVHLSYEPTRSNSVNLSYSKRVRRPSSWQMNPFGDYDDPTFRRVGNPYLNPEYTHSFEVGYSRLGDSYTISVSPYFRHTVDEISWHEEINDEGVSILTFENFATENSYGVELIGSLTLGEWLRGNASINGFRRETDASNVQSSLSDNALGYMTRLRLTAEITDGLSLQVSQFYRSGHDIPGGRIGSSTRTNIALQQEFLGERASLSLRGSDLLGATGFEIQRDTERFYQEYSRSRDPRRVQLNFRYTFGQPDDDRREGGRGPDGGGGGEGGDYGGDM